MMSSIDVPGTQHVASVKAIETIYRGYRFRSRTEARWAVVFDAMGWKWTYEEQGYEFDGVKYLPDFIVDDGCVVEIKPLLDFKQDEYPEIYTAGVDLAELHIAGDIPCARQGKPERAFRTTSTFLGICDNDEESVRVANDTLSYIGYGGARTSIAYVGEKPKITKDNVQLYGPIVARADSGCRGVALCRTREDAIQWLIKRAWCAHFPPEDYAKVKTVGKHLKKAWCIIYGTPGDFEVQGSHRAMSREAMLKGRQARFEHGERA